MMNACCSQHATGGRMQTTMDLLRKALEKEPAPFWTNRLKLARTTLHTAKVRRHLSPAIAGALAEEMGQDPTKWIVIAALESERDSACKTRMIKSLLGRTAVAVIVCAMVSLSAPSPAMASVAQPSDQVVTNCKTLNIMLSGIGNQITLGSQILDHADFTTAVKSDHCSIRKARMSRTDFGNHILARNA